MCDVRAGRTVTVTHGGGGLGRCYAKAFDAFGDCHAVVSNAGICRYRPACVVDTLSRFCP